jgi:ABC-2 type transport system permease protein
MAAESNEMRTLAKLTWVEMKLFSREPFTMAFTFALPIIVLFVMGGVFGNTVNPEVYRGVGAMDYYIPAYFGLVMTAIGIVALPVHLTTYRERGVLRRLRASSISVWSVLGSQMIVSFIIAILGSILLTILAFIVYKPHMPQSIILLIPAFILGVLCFTALGFFLGAVIPTTRAAQGIGIILFFVMLILGGAGPPPEVLTGAMSYIGDIMPLRYVILMLQDPWLGFGWNVNASLIVAGILVVAAILSTRFFKWN